MKKLGQEDILRVAEAAGLDKAVAQYREDVLAAAKAAADARGAFTAVEDAALEPWPPMQAGAGL